MTTPAAIHVAVPQGGVPAVPQVQVPPQQFAVPPMNGEPIVMRGQTEGMVPQNQPQQQQPAQQQPQAMGMADIQALINNALGVQQPTQPDQPQARPAWLPENVATFDVNSIQDPTIKAMASVLQSTGKDLDLNRVIGRALQEGDVSLIDYAHIHEKGGANAQQLAEISKGIVAAVTAKANEVTNSVYKAVGGEANWQQSTAIFNQVAPHELRVTVAQMLDSTNESIILAGAKIVAQFSQQSGRVPQQGAPLLNGGAAGQVGTALTKEGFQAELRNLKQDTPNYEAARESLFARRALGKSQGL